MTNQPQVEKQAGKPRILVAPLDWGLGHATRCIPIIRELLNQGAEVILAGEGAQEKLLRAEFPGLLFLELPGYRIQYSKTGRGLQWKMLGQSLKLKKAIQTEHQWLKHIVKEFDIHAVISDNRYGLYHSQIPSIFITHQLTIKSPWGKWTEKVLQKKNYGYINRFSECWIPDKEGDDNLAGELSHPHKKPMTPVKYIGWLSRCARTGIPEKKNQLLFILSGPEPQRSILENLIIEEISRYNGTAVVVRGLPGNETVIPSTNMIRFYNHLSQEEMNTVMNEAEYIISRSGYSTVMDAAALGRKCIFIPTPGQTEQEYLGKYLEKKGLALMLPQKNFSVSASLQKAKEFGYQPFPFFNGDVLSDTIRHFLAHVSAPDLG